MVSNGPKTHCNGMLTPFGPFWLVSPCILGLPRPFGGPKWPKMAQKGAKNGPKVAQNGQNLEIFPIFSFGWKCAKMVSKMVSNGSKTHFNGLLTLFWPILAGSPLHFGAPEAFWGSKMGPKWVKMVKISKVFRFSILAGNAIKWYPNGLKRSQNTFLWPVDPLLAHFGRFSLAFWGSRGLLGVQNGPKNGPKGAQNGPKNAQNAQNLVNK